MEKNRVGIFHEIADHVCKKYITNSRIIGLGSGSTVSAVLTQMARLIKTDDKKFIPSSLQIKGYAESLGLEIADESKIPDVDFVIDGADQIDSKFNMIKGGGGALLKEKILIDSTKQFVIICDSRKFVKNFNIPIPIEVHRFARVSVLNRLKNLGLLPRLRLLQKGYPYITDNGNVIYDSKFQQNYNVKELEHRIKLVPGVMEVGLFTYMANSYYKINLDNTFTTSGPSDESFQSHIKFQ